MSTNWHGGECKLGKIIFLMNWKARLLPVIPNRARRFLTGRSRKGGSKKARWIVPIFPELKEELGALFFDPKSEDREFVINRYRSEKQNLRTTLEKIFNRAKLPTIPKPFDNFRMTRSNEVYREFGAFIESLWIGHSSRVRADHYLMVTDADYLKASRWETKAASTGRPERQRVVVADEQQEKIGCF